MTEEEALDEYRHWAASLSAGTGTSGLRAFLRALPAPPVAPAPLKRHWELLATLGLVLLAVVIVVLAWNGQWFSPPPVSQ